MSDYELDLEHPVTEEIFQQAIDYYNSVHQNEFQLAASGSTYTLGTPDQDYCVGTLMQCAYFWEGYVSGQGDGDTYLSVDDSEET